MSFHAACAWDLRDAVVGSLVRVSGSGWFSEDHFKRVSKVTKLRVTLSDSSVWTRKGRLWGSATWSQTYAWLVLDEKLARAEVEAIKAETLLKAGQRRIREKLQESYRQLTQAQIDAITAILETPEND